MSERLQFAKAFRMADKVEEARPHWIEFDAATADSSAAIDAGDSAAWAAAHARAGSALAQIRKIHGATGLAYGSRPAKREVIDSAAASPAFSRE
jgi:hypothetical protein